MARVGGTVRWRDGVGTCYGAGGPASAWASLLDDAGQTLR